MCGCGSCNLQPGDRASPEVGSGVAIVESTWHNIATFEGGDVSLDGLSRGALVHLTGRLRTSKYTAADGTERIFTEVVADSLQVLEDEIQ
jgi:single-stranded DNA-binding protein